MADNIKIEFKCAGVCNKILGYVELPPDALPRVINYWENIHKIYCDKCPIPKETE